MACPPVLRVSVNLRLKNKDDWRDTDARGSGFQNVKLTPHDLAQLIGRGVAYSVQVKDGRRKKANFIASDVASVDIDKDLRIEQALAMPFCQQHLTILYRTPSHTEEHHRFRLVFAFERTIRKATEQRAINRALAMRFGGDMRATDATRLCFGSDLAPAEVFDGYLSNEVMDELIVEGKVAPQPDSVGGGRLGSVRASNRIAPTKRLLTRDGSSTTMAEVPSNTSVHCPFHDDANASAFVKELDGGARFLHCSACQMTWWDSVAPAAAYDFGSWDRAVEQATEDGFGLLLPAGAKKLPPLNIHKSATRHLSIDTLPSGITFIKSPKGSGKTTTLVSIIENFLFGESQLDVDENGVTTVKRARKFARVLLIGHRRALIRETCARLGLNCYLDDGDDLQENSRRKDSYGVCLDSLWKVQRRTYDLIVIDESEQVLAHFLAATLEQREGIFRVFSDLLSSAKQVVALDADLGWTSYRTICRLAHAVPASADDTSAAKPINIFYNKPEPDRKEILVFRTREQLLADFEQQVRAGKKIFFASNSKVRIEDIAAMLRDKHPKVTVRDITSTNSNSAELQDFIVHIKERIAEYQVVLASPSLGTGVDISFDGDIPQVDIVYGLFENLINTHFDIDQQLRRVRNPGEVRVWISPRTANFETELDAVKSDLVGEKDGLVTMFWGAELIDLAGQVVAQQRASKNRLKRNFLAYKAAQGWDAVDVITDSDMITDGRELLTLGRARHIAELTERVMKAKPVGQEEYKEIKERQDNNEEVSQAEALSAFRSSLEAFYVQPISRDMVVLEFERFRSKVKAYEGLFHKRTDPLWKEVVDVPQEYFRKKLRLLPYPGQVPWLLNELLSATPVYKDHRFDSTARYCAADLGGFVEVVMAHRGEIENLLGKSIPKDLHKKPTSFLGAVLNVVGVKQAKGDVKRHADGSKTYYYSVDQDSLDMLDSIVKRRTEVKDHWGFVHQLNGIESAVLDETEHRTPGGDVFHVYERPKLSPIMERMFRESAAEMKARFGRTEDAASAAPVT